VANPDSIGPHRYVQGEGGLNVIRGPKFPTHYVTPSISVRTPGNVTLAARGEYRGGHVVNINPIAVGRSVRSPLCLPYYESETTVTPLRADTPAIWRERCSPSAGTDYWWDGDYFKLRTRQRDGSGGLRVPGAGLERDAHARARERVRLVPRDSVVRHRDVA
jgi:hypothetical protein